MRVGFSGTRHGMTSPQKVAFVELIRRLKPLQFHHGSCQGADVEAARLVDDVYFDLIADQAVNTTQLRIVCHPGPDGDPHQQDSGVDDKVLPGKTHFARNREIVDSTDILVACPFDMMEQPRGGTWYTVGFARKRGKPVYIVWPDGTIEEPKVKE